MNVADAWPRAETYQRITAIDAHTEGEPFRVVVDGFPELKGTSILDYRRDARERFDHLRRALMWEPRGHADMYGCLLTPPTSKGADFGILFMHNEGFSTMCGHGIIAITTVAVETGMVEAPQPPSDTSTDVVPLGIDTPAGRVDAYACRKGARVTSVYFHNVPSFVVELDAEIHVPGLGAVTYDLAFGGAFYAYVQASELGVGLDGESFHELIDLGGRIKAAIVADRAIEHPFEEDLGFLYGVIFVGEAQHSNRHRHNRHSRNVCVFADGEIDRCPTGTGVSGRVALHHARGELPVGEDIVIESIIGSTFSAGVVETTRFGPYDAVVPRVQGRAFITGRHEFLIDPDDDLRHGFLLR